MRKRILSRLGVVLVLALAMASEEARGGDVFVEAYGSSTNDEVANCVATTQDGGFVVTGYYGTTGKNIFLAKFDSEGEELWRKLYAGGGDGEGRCVVEAHDGNFVMVGHTSFNTAGQSDFLLGKFDAADGNPLWFRTWGGGGEDRAHGVIEASDQSLWLVGTTDTFTVDRTEVVLAKINPSGSTLDYARLGKIGYDFSGASLAEVFDTDGFCVAGSVSLNSPLANKQILLAKFNHSLGYSWARQFGDDGQDRAATKIVRTSDEGLALAGWASGPSGPMFARGGFLLKLDTSAHYDWGRMIDEVSYSPPPLKMKSVVETSDGGLVLVGGYPESTSNAAVLLAKWSLSGTAAWYTSFGDATGCVANSVVEEDDQSLLLAGATTGYGMGGNDFLFARCYAAGATCMGGLNGPSISGWSPDENPFLSTLHESMPDSATTEWNHIAAGPAMYVSPICATTTYTVCSYGTPDFEYIQDAIDAASNGDLIELCDDTFTGVGNRDLDFQGKCLTVRSQSGDPDACIIDCEGLGRGFRFHTNEGCHAIVSGIMIRNGTAVNGGGVYIEGASPTITNCKIVDCNADAGSAIFINGGSPQIAYCQVLGNGWGSNAEATIDVNFVHPGVTPTIEGCVIADNYGIGIGLSGCGGGIADPFEITHCTIADNGTGILLQSSSDARVEHSILWGNDDQIILYQTVPPTCSIEVECSDVEDGWPGLIIFDVDPLFCNPAAYDYHLAENSPCASEQQPICGLIGSLDVGCNWKCTYIVCPDGSGDFLTIQAAIDAATNGDTICLCDATYTGTSNRDIDYGSLDITIRSQSGNAAACIIDCEDLGRGFFFHSGEGPDAVLEEITITNGLGSNGGGIYCQLSSSPTIRGCVISLCQASNSGGGLCARAGASPTIIDGVFRGNEAGFNGGGVFIEGPSSTTITGSVITGNYAANDGGGIYADSGSSPDVISCTLSGNLAASRGGGIFGSCMPERSIVWGNCANGGGEDGDEWYGNDTTRYQCCNDMNAAGVDRFLGMGAVCRPGATDIDADPLFWDPVSCVNAPTTAGDYHIHCDSPCVPWNQPECGLIGALPTKGMGDVTGDESVNGLDIQPFVNEFLNPTGPSHAFCETDMDSDGELDMDDVVLFIEALLMEP